MRNKVRLDTVDFSTLRKRGAHKLCDAPGCTDSGDHRAPKGRDRMSEYFWFCRAHAKDYNESWNYHAGMTPKEMEKHLWSQMLGDRPLWPLGARMGRFQDRMRRWFDDKRADPYRFFEEERQAEKAWRERQEAERPATADGQALAVLGLTGAADLATIKAQYKRLAKRYHPDANGGDKAAEEQLKLINEAYTLLKKRLAA